MKNLKKVLAFTLALAMIMSTMTTAFAANEWADKLSNLGLLLNTTDEELNRDLTRAVGLTMVLKALGYNQADANVAAERNSFVDMGNANWAKGFVVIGEELKITNGVSVEPKKFAPQRKLDKKSFVTFMLRALGYDGNEAWAKAGELGAAAKLIEKPEITKTNFAKGEAAMIMYNALKAEVQGDAEKRSLAQKLVDEGKLNKDLAVANGLLEAAPATLEVKSVSATNLKEVNVEFNTKVDVASAQSKQNYRLRNKQIESATVSEDGKTVVLVVEGEQKALENDKETTLTVTGVKTAEGVAIAKTVVNFIPFDNKAPEITNIRFTGPKNLEITFDEPVKRMNATSTPTITLTNGNRTYSAKVTNPVNFDGQKKVNVEAYTTFKDGENYVIGFGNSKNNSDYFYDYANYPNAYSTQTLTYQKDTTAPEVTVAKASQEEVVVEFNKPVTGVTVDNFYHTFSSYHPVALYKKSGKKDPYTNKSEAVSKLYLQFYELKSNGKDQTDDSRPLPEGSVVFNVLGAVGKNKVKDAWGNELQNTSIDLNIVADREAPEVSQVEVTGSKEVTVTFNKKIYKYDNAVYTLLDMNGKVVESDSKITANSNDDKVVVLSLSGDYAGKTMLLSIKGVEADNLYRSKMADYSTELTFTDKEWKAPLSAQVKAEGDTVENRRFYLYVTYGEAMDDSALAVKNYRIKVGSDVKDLKAHGDGDFFAGQNSVVRFELTYEKDKTDTEAYFLVDDTQVAKAVDVAPKAGAEVLISQNVKDLAGNMATAFQTPVTITEFKNLLTDGVESIVATDRESVVIKFKQVMENLDGSQFKFSGNHEFGTSNIRDDKTLEIFFKEGTELSFDPSKVTVTVSPSDKNTDIFGRQLSLAATAVTDKIAPTYAAFVKDDTNGKEKLSEAITNDYKVKGDLADKLADKAVVYNDYKDGKYEVTILYTEKIKGSTVATTTYEFNNGVYAEKVKSPARLADDQAVVLVVNKKDGLTKDDLNGLTVTQVAEVEDVHGNKFKGGSSLAVFSTTEAEEASTKYHTSFETKKDGSDYKVVIGYEKEIGTTLSPVSDFFELVGGQADKFAVSAATVKSDDKKIVEVTITRASSGADLQDALSLKDVKLVLKKKLEDSDSKTVANKGIINESLEGLNGLLVFERDASGMPTAVLERVKKGKFKVVLTYVEELKDPQVLDAKFEKPTANNFAVGDITLGTGKKTIIVNFDYSGSNFDTDKADFKIKQVSGIELADAQTLPEVENIVVTVPDSVNNND